MLRPRVTAYEGSEGYLFVSYAHRDTEQVLPVLAALQERGYRVWYDDGIAPGSEWPENIAQHLNDCALVLAFVSNRSMESANCRREITFALSKKKPFLGIVLEPTQMSLGMELQLSAQQCVMKYSYQEEARFLEKVCACPDMEPCLEKAPEPPAAPPAEELPAAKLQQKPVGKAPAAPVWQAAQAPAWQAAERKAVPQTPVPAGRTPERKAVPAAGAEPKKAPAGKKRLTAIICAIAAALVCLGIGTAILLNSLPVKVTPQMSVGRRETSVTLRQVTVTEDVVRQLNKLGKLNYLYFRECEFAPGAMDAWEGGDRLKSFDVSDSTGLGSLSFLGQEEKLWSLKLVNCGVSTDDFTGLVLPGVTVLDLSGNPKFTDTEALEGWTALRELNLSATGITGLAGIHSETVTRLDFRNTGVTDIACLAQWSKLELVDGSGTAVSDISPLAALTGLTSVSFDDCSIAEVKTVFQSLRITALRLRNNDLCDVSGFQNLTLLQEIRLEGNRVEDISWLEKSTESLRIVGLSGNLLTSGELDFLSGCAKMRELYLNDTDLSEGGLRFTRQMPELTRLSAVACGIRDIAALSGCPKLEWVRLAGNEITDVSAFAGMTASRVTMDLAGNQIRDVSALSGHTYVVLSLAWNPVDWSTLGEGSYMILSASFDPAFARGVPSNESVGYLDLMECPEDKQVAVQDSYGSSFVRILKTEEEFIAQLSEDGLDYTPWCS